MRPLRVLHVVGGLARGGVESWLTQVVRGTDPREIQSDFLVHSPSRGVYEDELEANGCRVIRCGSPHRLASYIGALYGTLKHHGPYDVVHSHVLHFSGIVLAVARAAGVRGRIAHSHTDTRAIETGSGVFRRGYLSGAASLVSWTATHILACSEPAAVGLLGPGRHHRERDRVTLLPYGIDLDPFRQLADGAELRRRHRIPAGAPVFGHVGRMAPEKNHAFLLDVAKATLAIEPNAMFVMIGNGPLKADIVHRARELGIADSVIFPDPSTDAPRWLTSVFDVFVFPSVFEGIPLALIEAQAAGLPCVVSAEAITHAADVIPGLLYRTSLNTGAAAWSEVLADVARRPRMAPSEAVDAVAATAFDLVQNRRVLLRLYEDAAKARILQPGPIPNTVAISPKDSARCQPK